MLSGYVVGSAEEGLPHEWCAGIENSQVIVARDNNLAVLFSRHAQAISIAQKCTRRTGYTWKVFKLSEFIRIKEKEKGRNP